MWPTTGTLAGNLLQRIGVPQTGTPAEGLLSIWLVARAEDSVTRAVERSVASRSATLPPAAVSERVRPDAILRPWASPFRHHRASSASSPPWRSLDCRSVLGWRTRCPMAQLRRSWPQKRASPARLRSSSTASGLEQRHSSKVPERRLTEHRFCRDPLRDERASLSKAVDNAHMSERYTCPCCGYRTLTEGPGAYDLCPVCFWEDDGMHEDDVASLEGPNGMTLAEGQRLYRRYGTSDLHALGKVRPPAADEPRDRNWRPLPRPAGEVESQYFLSDLGELLMHRTEEAREAARSSRSESGYRSFRGAP